MIYQLSPDTGFERGEKKGKDERTASPFSIKLIFLSFFFFFLTWTIFKVFIEFVPNWFLLYALVFWPWVMWGLSFPTMYWTNTSYIGRWSLNHWTAREVPQIGLLLVIFTDQWLLLFSWLVMSDSLRLHDLQHTRLPCPSPSPRVCSSSCPLSLWRYIIVSAPAAHFSFCPQSFPASGSFPMSQLFTAGA